MDLSPRVLLDDYRSGRRRPRDVLEYVYAAIERSGQLPVWISLNSFESALAALAAQSPDGLLYGLPFAVKDNIDVAGLPTTAACPQFAYQPSVHAAAVERLVQAGAIVIGKTNLDQFATGLVGTRSPYGVCSSVFDPAYVSGGSSSGSALAVALGQVSFALGTDTAGSGRVPAAFNALVGLKPTLGLISTRGVVPACRTLDCVSIFSRHVRDARQVLAVVAGYDELDPFSRMAPRPSSLGARPRLGIPTRESLEFFGDDESARLFANAVDRLAELPCDLVPVDLMPFREVASLLYSGPWVAERLAGLREFFTSHASDVHPVVRAILEGAHQYSAADAFDGRYRLAALRRTAEAAWRSMDVLVVPTAPTHYRIVEVLADPVTLNQNLGTYTNFVNLLDLSALAVPAGFRANGLPFGITLIGQAFDDDALVELGGRFLAEPTEPEVAAKPGRVWLAVAGAHLSGQPLNSELTSRGARLLRTTRTASEYRLFSLNTTPPKPGLVHSPNQSAHAIEVEVWELGERAFGSFVAAVPAPMTIGDTRLADGSTVKGFACEPYAIEGAREISHFGGWRAYKESLGRS